MPGKWKQLDSSLHCDCRIFTIDKHTRQSETTGNIHQFFVLNGVDWVNIIPITPENEVVMVRQYRHGIKDFTLELPGGALDKGELPIEGGLREMEEETGYTSNRVEYLNYVYPNPAIQSNACHTLVAYDSYHAFEQKLDSAEEIEVELIPIDQIGSLIASGIIRHSLVVVAFHYFHLLQSGFMPVGPPVQPKV